LRQQCCRKRQIVGQGQTVGKRHRVRVGPGGGRTGKQPQDRGLKAGQAVHRLFQKSRGPCRKGRGAQSGVAAAGKDRRAKAGWGRKVANQVRPFAIGQAQIHDHHIGTPDRQMPPRLCKTVGAAHPRTRMLAHQPQRLGRKATVLDDQQRHPVQRRHRPGLNAPLWHSGHRQRLCGQGRNLWSDPPTP